jgi:hypothetical protein
MYETHPNLMVQLLKVRDLTGYHHLFGIGDT